MADPTGISETPSGPPPSGVVAAPETDVQANGEVHKPYVPPDVTRMHEFTWRAVIAGSLLGLVFGASSLYLVLKVGMTVSASIPVAVLSITLFRVFSRVFGLRRTTILENNIVQTAGSAGESIAFGVGVTMPALMLIGYQMTLDRIMLVSVLGGILGILMMIPLRRAFIVRMHGRPGQPGTLLYPEGTACAQVLISGEQGGTSGATVFFGFGLAFAHKIVTEGMNLLRTTIVVPLQQFSKVAAVTGDMASELLGVGYIIGARTSSIMMAGAVLGTLVIAPTIYFFGQHYPDVIPPAAKPIGEMGIGDAHVYVRFIGAGCVAAAGIISMFRTLPMIVRSLTSGVGGFGGGGAGRTRRTDDDLKLRFVFVGCALLLGLLTFYLTGALFPELGLSRAFLGGVLGALLVLVFGFLFVTVSSRLTGEIGSSSNPISGMTVATLLMTCLIFLAFGMTTGPDAVLALMIGGVVCIAASNGGTTSQDLKTGFLVGATPRLQQWAIIIGALTSAVVIGFTLLLFNAAGNVYSQRDLPDVNLKDRLPQLTQTETVKGEKLHAWRPTHQEQIDLKVKPGEYLVDDAGQVVYFVDPTITGELKQRDQFVPVELPDLHPSKDEAAKLTETVTMRESGALKAYHVWTPPADGGKTPPSYVVDDAGAVRYQIKTEKVGMKFEAPKTQVMAIIINGLLQNSLSWTLVLIGACIAVTLELCGVSSLAFAVGVYIPMQYSTPIFLGGLVRWGVDAWTTRKERRAAAEAPDAESRAQAEVAAIAKTETSPGVLLASGLIAGGSLAGVLNAFLNIDVFEPVQKLMDFTGRLSGTKWDTDNAAFFDARPWASTLALAVFGVLIALLVVVGIGKLFWPAPPGSGGAGDGEGPALRLDQ